MVGEGTEGLGGILCVLMMGEGTEGLGGIFSDFVQSTRYIKQKDTSPLQGFST